MVSTRRSGATEPLERLETPPKRNRKHKSKEPLPIEEIMDVEASPEVIQAIPIEVDTQTSFKDISVCNHVNVDLTSTTELSATNTNNGTASTKRRHEEAEIESFDSATPSKRSRIEEDHDHERLLLSMFPPKGALDEEDLTEKPKNFGDSLRRRRNLHLLTKQAGKYSSLPRQKSAPRALEENPWGFQTFSQQELAAARTTREKEPVQQPVDEHSVREERSAAPEPETPRRGLFGSLRDIGSATIGRVFSPFNRSTSTPQAATLPHPRTEPSKRIAAWDIHYPQIEPAHENETGENEPEETESDRKRRTFEEKHGKTNRKFDHLHTTPADGDQDQLPFPVKKAASKAKSPDNIPSSIDAFAKKRSESRRKKIGENPPTEPEIAPLFGSNSHYARGTKDPTLQAHFDLGPHPALRQSIGNKRTLEQALPEEAAQAQSTPSRSFHPHVGDDEEGDDIDLPSTPAAKKQKMSEKSALNTPRSALKAPGSIGRSGMSARFNENPIASIKRMSPLAPAGYNSPNSLFQPFSMSEDDTQISNGGLTPSPNTQKNTLANTGKQYRGEILFKQHPGDLLSQAMNEATPSELRGQRVPYVWKDPQDPSWKPSLFNPRPGTFRLLDDDEIEEEQEYLNQMEQDDLDTPEAPAPDPPSTPRMSHAELPKAASASSAIDSTSAFEAANLEKRRADASKTKPRKASKLAEVTSARSRSPSPPPLDSDAADASDESAKTPSPVMGPATAIWTWDSSTNEYTSSSSTYPDFAYNAENELVPAFAIKSSSGKWDDKIKGPDGRTEFDRQNFYKSKYDDKWADANFPFGPALTYEQAAVGSKYTHDLIRKNDANCPELVKKCDERFALEWDAHQLAIENATQEGKELTAIHPDRDGIEMLDADEVL